MTYTTLVASKTATYGSLRLNYPPLLVAIGGKVKGFFNSCASGSYSGTYDVLVSNCKQVLVSAIGCRDRT
jgi:hypothetical protein